jgi:hypothetical protein
MFSSAVTFWVCGSQPSFTVPVGSEPSGTLIGNVAAADVVVPGEDDGSELVVELHAAIDAATTAAVVAKRAVVVACLRMFTISS